MKTLENHVLLYDNGCPMCSAYTKAFVSAELLDKNGRIPFTEAKEIIEKHQVDAKRACDEIALVNLRTGDTVYGIDSLVRVLGYRVPAIQSLLSCRPIEWMIKRLYAFISFNRKVIIPGKDLDGQDACRPNFSLRYRMAYLAMTWLVTSFVLTRYAALLIPFISPTNLFHELMICGGQILFQAVIVSIVDKNKRMEYLGNMMTISLAAALVLVVAMLFDPTPFAALILFAFVASLMLLEHLRRMNMLALPWLMTFTWVLYWIIVLFDVQVLI